MGWEVIRQVVGRGGRVVVKLVVVDGRVGSGVGGGCAGKLLIILDKSLGSARDNSDSRESISFRDKLG